MDPSSSASSPDHVREINLSELMGLLLGPNKRVKENIVFPPGLFPHKIKTRDELRVEAVFESCAFKTGISCVLGGAFGAALGLFSASVDPNVTGGAVDPAKMTVRQVFSDMKSKSVSYAKNFAIVGAMFAAIECTIESESIVHIVMSNEDDEFLRGRLSTAVHPHHPPLSRACGLSLDSQEAAGRDRCARYQSAW
ncbi:hypothetical protein HPB50_002601 [Hyalomma asiaticum]|uniref:Uncharacterized protein n=1 Tax=Hyalomma asiaticum TaxID=266040 RepID=A0ACB7SHA0_HYAAI|nr:hypothetical protein HPB50_002601 [Hyalomma asiaticum]